MKIIIYIQLILSYLVLANAINLDIAVYSFYDAFTDFYKTLINDFNRYAKVNNKDIHLKMTLFSNENTTEYMYDYPSSVEYLLKRKNQKHDLYVIDPIYTRKFSPFFLDLKEYLPEYIKLYSEGDAPQLSEYKGHWYSLPSYMKYKVLYSNTLYLEKYKKPIPKTWDQMIETGLYILENERNLYNNTNLVGYNNLFTKNENSVCSLYEYVYSFRDKRSSPFPEFNSKQAIEALYELKHLKNTLSSNELFIADEGYNLGLFGSGSILFISLWDGFNMPNYKMSNIPGKIEGISGATISALSVAIPNFLKEENKNAALEVLRFINSFDEQKKVLKDFNLYSGIASLYKDDKSEICSVMDCEFARNVQGINRPIFEFEDYELFTYKIINLIDRFLYKNEKIEDIAIEIDNISRFHQYTIDIGKSALIIYIVIISFIVLLLVSPVVLIIPKLKNYYKFLSFDLWITYLLGMILILASIFTFFRKQTVEKCLARQMYLTIGYTLIFIPLIYKLSINFPKINKYSQWIHKNKYLFSLIIIVFEIVINLFYLIFPFELQDVALNSDKNFRKCSFKSGSLVIGIIQIIIKVAFYIGISLLIFLEWNIKKIYYGVRSFIIFIFINGLLFIVYFIVKAVSINKFTFYYTINTLVYLLVIAINYIYMFMIRVYFVILSKGMDDEEKMINNLLKYNNSATITDNFSNVKTVTSSSNTNSSKPKSTYSSKILSYHYATESLP